MSHFCHECQQIVDLVSADNNVYCRECRGEFIEQLPERSNRSTMPVNLMESIFNQIIVRLTAGPLEEQGHVVDMVDGPPAFQMIFRSFNGILDGITRTFYEMYRLLKCVLPGPQKYDPGADIPANFDQLRGNLGGFGDIALGEHNFNDILTRLMEQADQEQSIGISPGNIFRLPMTQVSEKQVVNAVQCITCMESFVLDESVVVLECEHIFHRQCIEPWLRLHNTFPICRSVVDPHKWLANSTCDT